MLEDILTAKRADVGVRSRRRPLDQLLGSVVASNRDFEAALAGPHPAFILEIKPRSPSAGVLRAATDLAEILPVYREHASAVSVLTDAAFFGGSFSLLTTVRRKLPQPILCKDFVVDPYQVAEARFHGADAILLMLSVLDDDRYHACAELAGTLRMGILTEVHSQAELVRALSLGAKVIGINNRNLGDLTVDLTTTEALAPLVPEGITLITESGIRGHSDTVRLRSAVDGFLVGSALMGSTDVGRSTRELIFGPTKVCGLTNATDAEAARRLGATHGGLIFAAESRRRVSVQRATSVRAAADLAWTGVFVNHPPREIARVAQALDLTAVQLHGEETVTDIEALRAHLPPTTEIWKAARVSDGLGPSDRHGADRVVLDTFQPDRRGGTGRTFDWSGLAALTDRDRYLLGGGLGPENAAAAGATGIHFLDVNSGVEREPGLKDHGRLADFFAARRGIRRTHCAC